MFLGFFYELRRRKVPVGMGEAIALARALESGLHESALDGFYHVARSLLVHSEAHLDAFDQAFLAHFKGIEEQGQALADELLAWLKEAKEHPGNLTPEELAMLEQFDAARLFEMFEERQREQKARHDGGNTWIGTAGTSPFGNQGRAAREGVRVGGAGGQKSALQIADARRYETYRDDVVLDTRQLGVALRKLRAFTREGAFEELDLEGTIEQTARNGGELEVVVRPPRRSNTRVLLLMDVGGSMTPYASLVSRLFSAASKSTHFKELRTHYFHNCVYGKLFETHRMDDGIPVHQLLSECNRGYKLILVGDALMAPYELVSSWGYSLGGGDNPPGIAWLMQLKEHFEKSVWLNPEPRHTWRGNTIQTISQVFDMFPLTLEGLGEAVQHLTRGTARRGPVRSR